MTDVSVIAIHFVPRTIVSVTIQRTLNKRWHKKKLIINIILSLISLLNVILM